MKSEFSPAMFDGKTIAGVKCRLNDERDKSFNDLIEGLTLTFTDGSSVTITSGTFTGRDALSFET